MPAGIPKQRFRVVGSRRVLGQDPGETFEASLSPEQEARLIAAGHIVKAKAKDAKSEAGTSADKSGEKEVS